jgi:hypothetical protein
LFLSDITDFFEVMDLPHFCLRSYKTELEYINVPSNKKAFEPQEANPTKLALLEDAFGEGDGVSTTADKSK